MFKIEAINTLKAVAQACKAATALLHVRNVHTRSVSLAGLFYPRHRNEKKIRTLFKKFLIRIMLLKKGNLTNSNKNRNKLLINSCLLLMINKNI